MARYLDPKADLTFKRVFGEHPNLVASLLNSLLPLPDGEEIGEIEYMSPERVPRASIAKNSIVDVFCKTRDGRQFIVEMQMCWSNSFMQRVLFNSAKIYVDQLERADDFSELRPVYSLNLVDSVFLKDDPDFIHHYKIVHDKHTDRVIEGFHLVFVELPKFKPQSIAERKMAVLWLRFLTEIGRKTDEVPPDLIANAEIRQAIEIVEESAYSRAQLMGLDLFWDAVRVEKTLIKDRENGFRDGRAEGLKEGRAEGLKAGRAEGLKAGRAEGLKAGRAEGRAEGLKAGRAEGRAEVIPDIAAKMKAMHIPVSQISEATGLSVSEIDAL